MRFRNLLGLLAIGGAVAYAQKRRGGDLSLAGLKDSARRVIDNVKGQLGSMKGQQQSVGTSKVGTSTGLDPDDFATGSSGGYSGSYAGGSHGIDRKF